MTTNKLKYPTKNNSTCIICDDVRTEKSNKFILIGVYPGNVINLSSDITEDNPTILPSLAFCFWFRECKGNFTSKFILNDPEGGVIFERDLGSFDVDNGKILTYIVAVRNAEFKTTGTHKVIVSLNEKNYEFPLDITAN